MTRDWKSLLIQAGAVVGIILVGMTVALIGSRSNTLPGNDEIYHLLAARSLVESGANAVGAGFYDRAVLYTQYIALSFHLLGESLASAKAATSLFFGLLLAVVYLSLRRRIGVWQAVLCCALLGLAPHSLELATTVRFYMPQALLFWIGAMSCYRALSEADRSMMLLVIAVVSWALAFHLQPVTAVGALAVVSWAVMFLGYRYLAGEFSPPFGMSSRRLFSGLALAMVAALVTAYVTGLLEAGLERYFAAAEWNEGSRLRYYYWVMTEHYNPFWAIFPISTLIAFRQHPRFAFFCTSVFAISFVLLSFAGMKEDRYMYFALPFFFSVLAIALAAILQWITQLAQSSVESLPAVGEAPARYASTALAVAAVLFLVVSNLGYVAVVKDIVDGTTKREQPRWDLLAEEYGAEVGAVSVILTNSPNYSIYFLERLPIGIGWSRLHDGSKEPSEYARDFRTGAVLISEASSIAQIVHCVDSGLLVAEERQWKGNTKTGIAEAMVPVIESGMTRIDTPASWKIRLYFWESSMHSEEGAIDQQEHGKLSCDELEALLRKSGVLMSSMSQDPNVAFRRGL